MDKVINEITSFDEEFGCVDSTSCNYYEYYRSSIIISMLSWIKRNSPPDYKWSTVVRKIIEMYDINLDVVKGTMRNMAYYSVYYSLQDSHDEYDFENDKPSFSKKEYIVNAPYEIANYIVQTQMVGHYRFVEDRQSLCDLYNDIKHLIGKYYYKEL